MALYKQQLYHEPSLSCKTRTFARGRPAAPLPLSSTISPPGSHHAPPISRGASRRRRRTLERGTRSWYLVAARCGPKIPRRRRATLTSLIHLQRRTECCRAYKVWHGIQSPECMNRTSSTSIMGAVLSALELHLRDVRCRLLRLLVLIFIISLALPTRSTLSFYQHGSCHSKVALEECP